MKKKSTLVYPNIPSAIRPVPVLNLWTILLCTLTTMTVFLQTVKNSSHHLQEMQTTFQAQTPPIIRSQKVNSVTSSEISNFQKIRQNFLASRLQQWNLLHHSMKVTTFRTSNQDFEQFFKTVGYFTYCKDIDGLMDAMHMRHSPEQWRLFSDASKTSLKAVLLQNGNKLPSIPVACAPSTKEMYTTMNDILFEVAYKKYQREVFGDFKAIAVLLGLQAGYTKYSCFLCEWDSRARDTHYSRKHWPRRQSLTPGLKNIIHKP